jgi:hypothetical protein
VKYKALVDLVATHGAKYKVASSEKILAIGNISDTIPI